MNNKIKKVSIIIPTLNRGKQLLNTIQDILKQHYAKFEIIIVDQTLNQDWQVKKYFRDYNGKNEVKYIHIKEKGTPNAKNVGANAAKGDILIFLDDDIVIKRNDFIAQHVSNYENPKVGAVGGRVLMNSDRDINEIKEVGKFKYFGLVEITNFNANFRTEIDHVYGCNQSYRREAFVKAGGFKKIFKGNAHYEEADLSMRVKKAGYIIIFDPLAELFHLHSVGGCRVKNEYELRYWLIHNATLFYLRNYPHYFFIVYFFKQFFWALFSGIKRLDYHMFAIMIEALYQGKKYYETNKKNNQN